MKMNFEVAVMLTVLLGLVASPGLAQSGVTVTGGVKGA